MASTNDSFSNSSMSEYTADLESNAVPIILIFLSVVVIIVACVVGIALEIRDKQLLRSSSTASTKPIVLSTSRSIKESVDKLEEFDNPNYDKTPPSSKKENEDFSWDIVEIEMEEIDLKEGNTISIENTLEVGEDLFQRQKSRSCSDLNDI